MAAVQEIKIHMTDEEMSPHDALVPKGIAQWVYEMPSGDRRLSAGGQPSFEIAGNDGRRKPSVPAAEKR